MITFPTLDDEQLEKASIEELADAALRDHRPLTDAERSAFAAAPIDFVRGNLIAPLIAARRAHNMEVADLYAAFEAARAPFRQPDGTIDVDGMTAEERAEFLQARYAYQHAGPGPEEQVIDIRSAIRDPFAAALQINLDPGGGDAA